MSPAWAPCNGLLLNLWGKIESPGLAFIQSFGLLMDCQSTAVACTYLPRAILTNMLQGKVRCNGHDRKHVKLAMECRMVQQLVVQSDSLDTPLNDAQAYRLVSASKHVAWFKSP